MMLALGCGTPPSRLAKSHTPASAGTALVSEAPGLRLTGCPANCSGHGTCAGGQCYCAGGWAGVQCQQLAVAGCPLNCSGHGSCNHRTMLCVCAEYFAGVACEAAVPSCPNFCSHAGHCVDGACRCEPGRVGSDCAQLQLASAACPDDCGTSERGTCVAGACHCIAPATGASCAESTDPKTCPGACSAHGACDTATGQCTCDADWTGGMCELLVAQVRSTFLLVAGVAVMATLCLAACGLLAWGRVVRGLTWADMRKGQWEPPEEEGWRPGGAATNMLPTARFEAWQGNER